MRLSTAFICPAFALASVSTALLAERENTMLVTPFSGSDFPAPQVEARGYPYYNEESEPELYAARGIAPSTLSRKRNRDSRSTSSDLTIGSRLSSHLRIFNVSPNSNPSTASSSSTIGSSLNPHLRMFDLPPNGTSRQRTASSSSTPPNKDSSRPPSLRTAPSSSTIGSSLNPHLRMFNVSPNRRQ